MDVHKTKWSICIIHQDEIIGQFTIPSEFSVLEKLLEQYKGPKMYSVYEAWFCGFYLHYKLTAKGINNIVVASSKVPIQVGNLVKTDRRDAEKLSFSLSKGLLKGIHIPALDEINIRQILRAREQFKKKRTRALVQMKMLFLQFDIKCEPFIDA